MTKQLIRKLWSDDQGTLEAIEFLFMAVILGIGIIVGMVALRNAINAEFTALGNAILALNPGFTISGQSGCCAEVSGSQAIFIPSPLTPPTCVPNFIPVVITVPPCS